MRRTKRFRYVAARCGHANYFKSTFLIYPIELDVKRGILATFIYLSGAADYYMGGGEITLLKAGQIAVASPVQVHGAFNSGAEPFVFISIVAPCNAGYELANK